MTVQGDRTTAKSFVNLLHVDEAPVLQMFSVDEMLSCHLPFPT
jgi:hypothetical protein